MWGLLVRSWWQIKSCLVCREGITCSWKERGYLLAVIYFLRTVLATIAATSRRLSTLAAQMHPATSYSVCEVALHPISPRASAQHVELWHDSR